MSDTITVQDVQNERTNILLQLANAYMQADGLRLKLAQVEADIEQLKQAANGLQIALQAIPANAPGNNETA